MDIFQLMESVLHHLSYILNVNDVVSFTQGTMSNSSFIENVIDKRLSTGIKVPEWLELQKKDRKGILLRLPVRADVTAPIEEHLIVELYSK
jgi:small subunit ribosomal protein S4